MKKPGIYRIENSVTGMFYIGSAVNLYQRERRHFNQMKSGTHPNRFMMADYEKHGAESFKFSVLEFCEVENLLAREQVHIDATNAAAIGYNIALSAFSPMKGRPQTEETRAKMRAAHAKRKPISEETRQKMREAAKEREAAKKAAGYTVPEETREKLRIAATGRPVSEESREKARKTNSKPLSTPAQLEAHAKLSESLKGRPVSQEEREKRRQRMLELWQDPEFREKTIAAMRPQE